MTPAFETMISACSPAIARHFSKNCRDSNDVESNRNEKEHELDQSA